MKNEQDLQKTLQYMKNELNRVQTIAGTLSTVESQHQKDLLDYGDDRLNQVATEEQNASRQLGEIKQICLTLVQKIDEIHGQTGDSDAETV